MTRFAVNGSWVFVNDGAFFASPIARWLLLDHLGRLLLDHLGRRYGAARVL